MNGSVLLQIFLLSLLALLTPPATGLIHVGNSTGQSEKLGHHSAVIPPMLILQRGCTGSSVVIRMARNLLAELGVPVYPLKTKEIARTGQPNKNPWYTPDGDLADAMRKGVQEASDAGQVLVFNAFKLKSWTQSEEELSLNKALLDMDTRTVIVHRRNPLDIVTCEIRDCFESVHGIPRGHPVNEMGQEDSTCFKRRSLAGEVIKTKAFVNVKHLSENLQIAQEYPQLMQESLKELGFKGGSIVYFEDLVSHEWSAANLHRSSMAWKAFLSSLGVEASRREIHHVLKKDVGTYPPPEPHSASIYNLQEVEQMLSGPEVSSGSWLRT